MAVFLVLLIGCQIESGHELEKKEPEHVHDYKWVTMSEATILTPKMEKEVCSLCSAESGKTRNTEEYKSIEGYWESQKIDSSSASTTEMVVYLSLDNTSSGQSDVFSGNKGSDFFISGLSGKGSYSWVTDANGKRTSINIADKICPVSEIYDENGSVTLNIKIGEGLIPGVYVDTLTMSRISAEQHNHVFVDGDFKADDYEHWKKTNCGDAHPSVANLVMQHEYDVNKPEVCTVCQRSHEHDWDSGKVTKEATCTEEGIKLYTCRICKIKTKTEAIAVDSKNHDWNSGTVTTAANCTEKGVRTYTCSRCNATKTEEIPVAPENHVWNSGTVTKAATCTLSGEREYVCSKCNETRTDVIDALGHDYKWVTKDEATFLTPKTEKEACSRCSAETGKTQTTKEYKSVEGYWMSLDGSSYMSLDNSSVAVLDSFRTDAYITRGMSQKGSYRWTVDENGKRTGFIFSLTVMGMTAEYSFAASESVDNSGIWSIALVDKTEQDGFGDMTLTRKSTSQHTHVASSSGYSKPSDESNAMVYHILNTNCGDAHPAVTLDEFHIFDDPDKPGTCSKCGYEVY